MDVQETLRLLFDELYGKEVNWGPKAINPHGRVVDFRQEAFHDVTIYEDGYIERFYICD